MRILWVVPRFGPEVVNYGSGSGLNRVSFLRHDPAFLRVAVEHPDTVFVVLNGYNPLASADNETHLRTLRFSDVHPALAGQSGKKPFEEGPEDVYEGKDLQFDGIQLAKGTEEEDESSIQEEERCSDDEFED